MDVNTVTTRLILPCGNMRRFQCSLWYDQILNRNGRNLTKLIENHDLFIHNHRGTTCKNRSIIDFTLSNKHATNRIFDWKLKQIAHMSDHKAVLSQIDSTELSASRVCFSTWKFNDNTADWERFCDQLQQEMTMIQQSLDVEVFCKNVTGAIQESAFKTMKVRKYGPIIV